jgi:Fe-S-cluster-containing hydrogenase component 2
VIYVDEGRCAGCGLCVEACPTGAMRLVDGVAQVEQSLCRECEVCLSTCPNGAILVMQEPIPVGAPAPIPSPTRPVAPAPRPGGVRPWLGATMAFIQREVVPRAAVLWESRG